MTGFGVDRIVGGNDSDTFWGREGNDIIEGGDGADIALGGEGNDIITDLAGDDIPKGGPGNDAIDAGPGLDIIMSGDGNDFTNGGANINEAFLGAGDDFAIAGEGEDAVFGDSGDDWMEGGNMPDLLIGDSSSLFFDDHNLPGHDVQIGQAGDDDYDMEGGDDIGVGGPGIEKNAGSAGYDWIIGVGDPQPQDADLALPIIALPLPVNQVRDRYNEVEALSGWIFDDIVRGDDIVPANVGGGGFIGCDALDQDGLDRIAGLDALVPALTIPAATVQANASTNHCLLTGNVWGDGNILLGGAGSDTLEGRGANDILDGDQYLNVRLSIRTDVNDPVTEIGTTDLMENAATSGNFGPGTVGMTLQQAVFAGLVDPGNIAIVREILDPGPGAAIDTALFAGPADQYLITVNVDGSITVADTIGAGAGGGGGGRRDDGVDTLWNIEQLSFCPVPGVIRGTCDAPRTTILASDIGATPDVQVSPPTLAFGTVSIGGNSVALPVTVNNTGATNVTISSVTLTDPGAQFVLTANDCPAVLPAGQLCTITVTFDPNVLGPVAATLTIAHSAAGSPFIVALTGTGVPATAPLASVSPAALLFGSINNNTTTPSQAVVVNNTGDAVLSISSITLTGADPGSFTITANGCLSVSVGSSCTIQVAFAPTTVGAKTATLSLVHNGPNSPTGVLLAGTSLTPPAAVAAVSPSAINFGAVSNNTTSSAQSIVVVNTGTSNLSVSGVTVGGADAASFAVNNGCTTPLGQGGICTIGVTFSPTSVGAKSASVSIAHNAGSPSVVTLAGTGIVPTGPVAAVSPASLDFLTQDIGTTSATQAIVVQNTGNAGLVVSAATLGGADAASFGIVSNGCATVTPAANCTIIVEFAPTTTGLKTATVTIGHNAAGTPSVVTLTGTGTDSRHRGRWRRPVNPVHQLRHAARPHAGCRTVHPQRDRIVRLARQLQQQHDRCLYAPG